MTVLWLTTHDRENPSSRFRVWQYVAELAARGIHSRVSALFNAAYYHRARRSGAWVSKGLGFLRFFSIRAWEVLGSRRYDVVVVLREVFPVGPSWLEAWLLAWHPCVVYDFDDAVFSRFARAANPIDRWKDFNKAARLIRGARRTVAGSAALAEYARRYSDRVTVIPTVVDTDPIAVKAHRARGGDVVIGWMGTRNNLLHLRRVEAALERLQAKYGVIVRVVSNEAYRPERLTVENLPWSEANEAILLSSFDIGLMPLEDDEYSRGKCAFKAIQYLAHGVPAVCSPVGENLAVVADGVTGFTAAAPEEWFMKLERLVQDPELRARLGREGRALVERRYSLRAGAALWVTLLRDLVPGATV